jgi:hypothetical protein
MTMTGLKTLAAAALISTISATSALAQAAPVDPDAVEAEYPNRDLLNGGALTPAGRMGLEFMDGAAPAANNARAEISRLGPSFRAKRLDRRHHQLR